MSEIVTITDLIERYREDDAYRKNIVHRTRTTYDANLRRIHTDRGDARLFDIKREDIRAWYAEWGKRGTGTSHALMIMLRIIFNFGSKLEDRECDRLVGIMSKEKFKQPPHDERVLTAEQARAIRAEAHRQGFPSIALQQAFRDIALRQSDTTGEWVPLDQPGVTDILSRRFGKWLHGARWDEIDGTLTFRHASCKTGKRLVVDLKDAEMLVEEFNILAPGCVVEKEIVHPVTKEVTTVIVVRRELLPAKGPIIVNETTGLPYIYDTFRRRWRDCARGAGVPDNIKNRHSRAGRLTEVIANGASIEDAQKLAQHSTTQMTSRYWRGGTEAVSRAMKAGKRRSDVA